MPIEARPHPRPRLDPVADRGLNPTRHAFELPLDTHSPRRATYVTEENPSLLGAKFLPRPPLTWPIDEAKAPNAVHGHEPIPLSRLQYLHVSVVGEEFRPSLYLSGVVVDRAHFTSHR